MLHRPLVLDLRVKVENSHDCNGPVIHEKDKDGVYIHFIC